MINNNDWEDMIIYLTQQDAINSSITYPNIRIEIFGKNSDYSGFSPTYNYYKHGKLYKSSNK
jgi:hypothetical protein